MRLHTNTQLGRYTITGRLASGGMGVVYTAINQALGQPVAVKVLADNLSADANVRKRFEQEALTQARLIHPNIVRVFDLLTEPELAIVMELVRGPSLASLIAERAASSWSVAETVDVMLPVLHAIAFAHEQGVVHRDLKPGNILLDTAGERVTPKVSDFGIAKLVGATSALVTKQGSVLGTHPFMSPEQFRGVQDVTPAADVFALGMIVWHLLAGRLPVDPQDLVAVADLYTGRRPIPTLTTLRPDVSPALAAAVHEALRLDPGLRTQHVSHLVAQLQPMQTRAGWSSAELLAIAPDLSDPNAPKSAEHLALNTPQRNTYIERFIPEVAPSTVEAALAARGSKDFDSLEAYQDFLEDLAQEDPAHDAAHNTAPPTPAPPPAHASSNPMRWALVAALVVVGVVGAGAALVLTSSPTSDDDPPQHHHPTDTPKPAPTSPGNATPTAETASLPMPKKLLASERKKRFKRGHVGLAKRLVDEATEHLNTPGGQDAAVAALTQAIAKDPSHIQARVMLARTLVQRGALDEALTGPLAQLYQMETREARQALLQLEGAHAFAKLWARPELASLLDDVAPSELVYVPDLPHSACVGWSKQTQTLACTWHCSGHEAPAEHTLELLPLGSAAQGNAKRLDLGAHHKAERRRTEHQAAQRDAVRAISRAQVAPRALPTWTLTPGAQPLWGDHTVRWDPKAQGGTLTLTLPDGTTQRATADDARAWRGCAQSLGTPEHTKARVALLARDKTLVLMLDHSRVRVEGDERDPDAEPNTFWSTFAVMSW